MDDNKILPKYIQLKNVLKGQIIKKEMDLKNFPAEEELRVKYGLSICTIKRALKELVKEKYIKREQGRGTFVIYDYKKTASQPEKVINFLFYRPTAEFEHDEFYIELFEKIEYYSNIKGYKVVFSSIYDSFTKGLAIPEVIKEGKVSGSFLIMIEDRILKEIDKYNAPFVAVDYNSKYGYDSVVADNLNGAKEAVKYLIGLGHEKIGYVTWLRSYIEDWPNSVERMQGYTLALEENGIAVNSQFIRKASGDNSLKSIVEDFLKLGVTGMFCFSDHLGFGLVRKMKELNIGVPEKISVIGCGDSKLDGNKTSTLTTVKTDLDSMARKAVDILVGKIEGAETPAGKTIIPTELVIKSSCRNIKISVKAIK